MIRFILSSFLIFFTLPLCAMFTGNPAEPALLTKGIRTNESWCSFRFGYANDWVYNQAVQEYVDFEIKEDIKLSDAKLDLISYSGLLTLNFIDHIDLYGLIGSSRIQIDQNVYSKQALSWGVGTKVTFFEFKNFLCGADLKYFYSLQIPKYIISEDRPYNCKKPFQLEYSEIQGSIGFAYRIWQFVPYINGTYITTTIQPKPEEKFLVRYAD